MSISTSGVLVSFADTNSIIEVSEQIFLDGLSFGGITEFAAGSANVTACATIQGPDRCDAYAGAAIMMGLISDNLDGTFDLFFDLIDFDDPTFPKSIRTFELAATPVPVPAAVWLLCFALGSLATMARKK